MDDYEYSVPVIVVGGGASGAVAAHAAASQGASVLLIEQDASAAGTTAMSQGLMCAAGTRQQKALGIDDSADTLYADIIAKTRGEADPVIARAVADGSGPALDWLTDEIGYPFALDTGFRAAYGHSRQRMHDWPAHGGADMVQLLHQKLADRGGALVLASGGFAANHGMVAANMPEAALARHNGHEGNHGDGIRLGAALGAALGDMGSYQGYAMLADPHGITVPPGILVEGGILVNTTGARFTDEVADIAGMVHPVMAQPDGTAWVVFDAAIEALCAYTQEVQALRETGAIRVADSIEALAAMIGGDIGTVRTTLEDAASAAKSGQVDAQGRAWGKDHPPRFPLHAVKVCGAIYHTQGGLQIDGDARVLRADGKGFVNLFASGGAARGVSGPSYWGYLPAMGLGSAITLGRIAGLSAAAV